MSVNGVTNNDAKAYGSYNAGKADHNKQAEKAGDNKETKDAAGTASTDGVIYESTADAATINTAQKYKPDAKTIAKMKDDLNNRKAQLLDLVKKMMNGQANAYGKAHGKSKNNFDSSKIDPAAIKQAQEDIAEDGYWGVNQTSQRILDFATALTGGDPDKIEEMRAAFEKGFKQAEETFGGKLPDISQQTYDAVMAGFDKMKEDAGIA